MDEKLEKAKMKELEAKYKIEPSISPSKVRNDVRQRLKYSMPPSSPKDE